MSTNTTNKVSITDASKKLGINRSRLNQIINGSQIKKTKVGKVVLVEYNEVQNLVQALAAEGKIRTPRSSHPAKNQIDRTMDLLVSELQFVRNERDQLREKLTATQSEVSELRGAIKLLNGTVKEPASQSETKSKKFKLPFIGQIEITST